jgi:hypothetical protein
VADELAGCRLRLDRAKAQINELDREFRSYLTTVDFQLLLDDPYPGDIEWDLKVEDPRYLSVIVGEAVQNMRTALDYLVYELAALSVRPMKLSSRPQFPIATTVGSYYERGRKQIWPLSGDLRRRIRKLQPYQAADPKKHPLAVLHRLSNADRHRLLKVVHKDASRSFVGDNQSLAVAGTDAIATPAYLYPHNVEKLRRRNPNLRLILPLSLVFPEEGNTAVLEGLKWLLWNVTEIIDSFDSLIGEDGLLIPVSPFTG